MAGFHLCKPIRRFHKVILLAALGATALGGYFTSQLGLDTDLRRLIPNSYPSVQAAERVERELGSASQLRVALKSQSFDALVRVADVLAGELAQSEYVRSVDYQNDVEFYETHALMFLSEASLDSLYDVVQGRLDEEKQALNPFLIDDLFADPAAEAEDGDEDLAAWEAKYEGELPSRYYLNPDSTVLVMSLNASQSATLALSQDMVADVRGRVAAVDPQQFAPDMEVFYGSSVKNQVDEYEAIEADIFGTLGYGLGGVFLLLILIFRGIVMPVLISLSMFATLMWTFGIAYLVIGDLNIITGFLFVVLFGMGADYGIHAMARYRESRQSGEDSEAAIHRMVCLTGSANFTAAFTTSAAFFALMLLDFKGFSELGLITGLGMLLAVFAMAVVLPSLAILSENLGFLKVKVVPGKPVHAERRRLPFARTILVGGALVTTLSIALFSQVEFEYDFTNLRIITEERAMYGQVSAGVFTRSESPALVLTDSREEVAQVVDRVEAIIASDSLSPTVGSVESILSVLPANQPAKLEKIRRLRALVEDEVVDVVSGEDKRRLDRLREFLQVDEPFNWEDFPEKDRERFADRGGGPGNFVLIYPNVALRDGRNAIAFRDDIGVITTNSGEEHRAASTHLINADMLSMITAEGPIALGLALAMVFLAAAVFFRSAKAALFIVSPTIIGILWMGGAMHLIGMQLNFFNLVAFPSIVGIGDDAGVHIHHRYRAEGPGSLPFVMRRTGAAISMSSATTMVGYSGLITAQHPGLRSIGILAVIGLFFTYVAAVVLLPAFLEVFDKMAGAKDPA